MVVAKKRVHREKAPEDPVDQEGFLKDIDVQSIDHDTFTPAGQKTRDVDHFFSPTARMGADNGERRQCRTCKYVPIY